MAGGDALERLQRAMSARLPPTPFVGAGLSSALTNDAPHASWIGLLRDGVKECERVAPAPPSGWADRMNGELDHADVISCIAVADQITRRLRDVSGGEGFRSWIQRTVGRLQSEPERAPIITALRKLAKGKLIVTTNYDTLVEDLKPGSWKSCTWTDPDYGSAQRLTRTVLHLHGLPRDPRSIILGSADYERLAQSDADKLFGLSLFSAFSFIFIGCGTGLGDPHIGLLIEFVDTDARWRRLNGRTVQLKRSYILVRGSELRQFTDEPISAFIDPVAYGSDFEDLGPFLEKLAARQEIDVSQDPAFYERMTTRHGTALLDLAGPAEELLRSAQDALQRAMYAIGQVEHRSAMPPGMGQWGYEDRRAVHEQLAASVASPAENLDSCVAQAVPVFSDMGALVGRLKGPGFAEYSADLAPMKHVVADLAKKAALLLHRVRKARDDLDGRVSRYTTDYRGPLDALRSAHRFAEQASSTVALLNDDLNGLSAVTADGEPGPADLAPVMAHVDATAERRAGEADVVHVKVRGKVAAGEAILIDADDGELLAVPARYAHHRDAYALKVQGLSMTGAGILDGDYVIVEPTPEASNGDMVVVSFPSEDRESSNLTVKWWNRQPDGTIMLESTAPGADPKIIEESAEARIEGKVVAVERWAIRQRGKM